MRRALSIAALVLAAVMWLTALAAAPAAAASAQPLALVAAGAVYAAGSIICHQQPERSFHREGAQLPVCARCCGLYAGGLVGVVLWPCLAGLAGRPSARASRLTSSNAVRWTLGLTALPTLVSVTTAWLGWWDPANLLRAVLAVPFGAAIGAAVTAVAAGDLR